MGKIKPSRASEGRMRYNDQDAGVAQGPGEGGNDFHIQMQEHRNGPACIRQIVKRVKESGMCTVEANAPMELITAAHEEAEKLWKDGAFGPAWRVFDENSRIEAQVWHPTMPDEDKVFWLRQAEDVPNRQITALKALQTNMSDFSTSLMERFGQEMGIKYDCFWNAMVSCYTGDRLYDRHIDNPHQGNEGFPDNGMRLTLNYYINPHWEPNGDNGGGLDVYLTDPRRAPESASEAKKSPKFRVAPHADTLVLLLSDRMAHQVIPTRGKGRWYCLTVWCFEEAKLTTMLQRWQELRNPKPPEEDSDMSGSEID